MSGLDGLLQDQTAMRVWWLILGGVVTWLFGKLSAKTGVFRYFVSSTKLATSADDAIFGSVRTTWQGHEVRNLYLVTIEVENSTSRDYENLQFKVFSGAETVLLNQRTEIVDTPYIIRFSGEFESRLHVDDGQVATPEQTEEYSHNREYMLPTLNRGQTMRFSYLCTNPNDDNEPNVHISTITKGVRLKWQRTPHLIVRPIFGVPVPVALTRALVLAVVTLFASGMWVSNIWLASAICMFVGLAGQLLGALAYRAERFVRQMIVG